MSLFDGERRRWCQSYPATASSVPRARHELARFAADAGAAAEQLEEIRLATSEAVTNVVLHAYDGQGGEVHLGARLVSGELVVQITDDGAGITPRLGTGGLGLGLALIAGAADELAIVTRPAGGTELRMRFGLEPGAQTASAD